MLPQPLVEARFFRPLPAAAHLSKWSSYVKWQESIERIFLTRRSGFWLRLVQRMWSQHPLTKGVSHSYHYPCARTSQLQATLWKSPARLQDPRLPHHRVKLTYRFQNLSNSSTEGGRHYKFSVMAWRQSPKSIQSSIPTLPSWHLGLCGTHMGFFAQPTQKGPSHLAKFAKSQQILSADNSKHVWWACCRSSRRERAWERTTEGRLPAATSQGMRFACTPFNVLVRVRAKRSNGNTVRPRADLACACRQVATIKQQSRAVLMRSASEGTDSVDATPCPGKLEKEGMQHVCWKWN